MTPACANRYSLALGVLLAGVLAVAPESASAAPTCAGAGATARQASTRQLVRSTLCLLNAERRRHGLRRVRLSKRLSGAAGRHSRDMVRNGYFSHTSLSGATFVDRIRRSGYLNGAFTWMVAENLAWGAGSLSSPGKIVQAWMHSPGHRHNILTHRFVHIGIGVVRGAPQSVRGMAAATYTTDFGFRR